MPDYVSSVLKLIVLTSVFKYSEEIAFVVGKMTGKQNDLSNEIKKKKIVKNLKSKEIAVEVGKKTWRQNSMALRGERKRKKIVKDLRLNETDIPVSFAESLSGIPKELNIEFFEAGDAGKRKRREALDSCTLSEDNPKELTIETFVADDAGNVVKKRKEVDTRILSEEFESIPKRTKGGKSFQGKEKETDKEDIQKGMSLRKTARKVRTHMNVAKKSDGIRKNEKVAKKSVGIRKNDDFRVIYSKSNRKVLPRAKKALEKLNRYLVKGPIMKGLKDEVHEAYGSHDLVRSELHKALVDSDIIDITDDEEENYYPEVKKEDIIAKETVLFSTDEIGIDFTGDDIKRLLVGKLEKICQLAYTYLDKKREETLNHGRVSVLPSSVSWNSAKKYSKALANWMEFSNDTLEKLSPVSDDEKKFNVDGEEPEEGVAEENEIKVDVEEIVVVDEQPDIDEELEGDDEQLEENNDRESDDEYYYDDENDDEVDVDENVSEKSIISE